MISRYSRPEMRAIWTDENKLDFWLQIELHASEALVKEGIVPKADFAKMKTGAKKCFANLPALVRRQKKLERTLNHDVIGFTTAVAENYTPPSSSVSSKARRLSGGAWPVARVAVVSRSLNFDLGLPLFARQGQRPIVVTTEDADPTRLRQVAEHADVLQCGRVVVDFSEALHRMADLGAKVVLSEGGPSINGSLIAQDLVDEVLISISPRVGGGESGGIARGVVLDQLQEFVLRHVLTEDHFLFLRYVRQTRDSQPHSPSN